MPLPTPITIRNKIIELYGSSHSSTLIASQLGISSKTVKKYLSRYLETGAVYVKKSSGRPKKLSTENAEALKNGALNNRFLTNAQLINYTEGLPSISANTVTNYLRQFGIKSRIAAQKPLLNSRDKAIRHELAARNLQRPEDHWERTVFIDEFHIETSYKRKVRVKRYAGQRFEESNIDKYNVKNQSRLTAVCCFSSRGLGPIKIVSESFNAEKYIEYLSDQVFPYASELFGPESFYLLHDNARIHTARIVTSFLTDHIPGRLIEHPPYLPDLNPIENLGNQFKRIFRQYMRVWPIDSDFQLNQVARVAWREVGDNQALVDSLIQSVRRRYQAVVNVSGSTTRY